MNIFRLWRAYAGNAQAFRIPQCRGVWVNQSMQFHRGNFSAPAARVMRSADVLARCKAMTQLLILTLAAD